jgi:hypothetical protein
MFEKYLVPMTVMLGMLMSWVWWNIRRRGSNRLARPGTVFVCPVCGKRSRDRDGTMAVDGWDTSCRTWAELVRENSIVLGNNGRVRQAVAA